jgi:uncharacterized protein
MPDTHALPRLVDELVWTLRRSGFVVAPSQVLDLLRAIRALGWDDPSAVREATAALVLQRASERSRFDETFGAFFARSAPSRDLWERLRAQGFTDDELAPLRELLEAMRLEPSGAGEIVPRMEALLEGGFEMDRLLQLAGIRRELDELKNPLQVGFFTQRAARSIGIHGARERLAMLRARMRDALGVRGDALADALARELDRAGDALRDHVQQHVQRKERDARAQVGDRRRDEVPFTSLPDSELEEVYRAVRGFADRLRGAERVRARRARRGRIDLGRTMRALTRTGGVPFKPVRRHRRRDKPRLILLCDVSESVRTASRFMLELVYAAHELFDRTQSFVFVSELGETTALFERESWRVALAVAYGGEVVPVTDNSNYGRVLRAFEARHLSAIDRRTTVVILGDGRTNYHDASEDTLARIRSRARALYWFCSEPRMGWSTGDSAMPRYAPHCTRVFEVTTARELEEAARTLVWSR